MKREPTFGESLLALSSIVIFIFGGYFMLHLEIELMLIAAAAFVAVLAWRLGFGWKELERAITEKLTTAIPAILIIWVIGIVIASFIFSGTIPLLIVYGMQLIEPQYIFVSSFLICVVFSTVTGTSWGSIGTAGVALMSIAVGLGAPLHITAAAAISGAVFGDKMSPLSETTNLTAATVKVPLYEHIKSMIWTTLPASLITCAVFFIVGQNYDFAINVDVNDFVLVSDLGDIFNWSVLLLIPFFVILGGSIFKQPPVPTMLVASLIALIIGVLYQGFSLQSGVTAMLEGFDASIIPSAVHDRLSDDTLGLIERGGIVSMVGIVVIIFCGYAYTAIITETGFFDKALSPLTGRFKKRGPIMCVTLFTELVILGFSGISYVVAIMIPPMFKDTFRKADMGPKTLSRSIEDVGTVMAPMIPWGTSGAFYAATLGVPVYGAGGYGVWCVMAYITPMIAIVLAFTGIGIYRADGRRDNTTTIHTETRSGI